MAVDHRNWFFHPDIPFYWTDWREQHSPRSLDALPTNSIGPVKRLELAQRMAQGLD